MINPKFRLPRGTRRFVLELILVVLLFVVFFYQQASIDEMRDALHSCKAELMKKSGKD